MRFASLRATASAEAGGAIAGAVAGTIGGAIAGAIAGTMVLFAGCTANELPREARPEEHVAAFKDDSAPRVTARAIKQDFARGPIESAVYPQYEVEFTNAEAYAVRITRYTATWPGNKRLIEPGELVLAPGRSTTTTFVVKPDGNPIAPKPSQIALEWTAERVP